MSTPCEFRVCPSGCVHMTFGGTTTVHLTARDFAQFVAGVEQIARKLSGEPKVSPPLKSQANVDFH